MFAISLLPLAVFLLLRFSPIQTLIAQKTAQYLSEQLGTEIGVGKVDLTWFLNLKLENVKIIDKQGRKLLGANEIIINPRHIDFKRRTLIINKISLKESNINLVLQKSDSVLNLQFLIDYFSSKATPTPPKPAKPLPWALTCNNVLISDSHFMYRDECCVDTLPAAIDFASIEVSGLNLDIRNLSLKGDSIHGDIKTISARERSGFRINSFSTLATVSSKGLTLKKLKVKTDNSSLDLDVQFNYPDWDAYNYFLDSIKINGNLRQTHLDMKDISYFAPDIKGMDNSFDIHGEIKGTVSSFKGKGMDIRFGQATEYRGSLSMNGLPDWEETFINTKIEYFSTTLEDINRFRLPGGQSLQVSNSILNKLGKVKLKGNFTGFYNDFVSRVALVTDVGNLKADILLKRFHNKTRLAYEGNVQAENLNLGKLFALKDFGSLNLDVNVKGQGVSFETVSLSAKGNATNIEYKGNVINNFVVDGTLEKKKFSGSVLLMDQLINLTGNGMVDFTDSIPVIKVQALLKNTNLARLNLIDRDLSSDLSTRIKLDFSGNSIDNLLGNLRFDSIVYSEAGKTISLNSITLQTSKESSTAKLMVIRSDVADAEFRGDYTFNDFSTYMENILSNYIPSLSKTNKPLEPEKNRRQFDYTIRLKDTHQVSELFIPSLSIAKNTSVKGSFDPQHERLEIMCASDWIHYLGFSFRNWKLAGKTVSHTFHVESGCDIVDLSSSINRDTTIHRLEQVYFSSDAVNNNINFKLGWNDLSSVDHNKAAISGALSFSDYPKIKASFDHFEILANDTTWRLQKENQVVFDTARVTFTNFRLSSKGQSLKVDGAVSHQKEDNLNLFFTNFDISQFDFLFNEIGIDFDGQVNGSITASNLYAIPNLLSEITIKKFGFNHEPLGEAHVNSSWNNETRALVAKASIIQVGNNGGRFPVIITGEVYPDAKHNNLNLHAQLDNFSIGTMQPFLSSVFSRLKGGASGSLSLTGDFGDPSLAGKVSFRKADFLIDYLKTNFLVTGEMNFEKNKFYFKNIELADSLGNKGISSGTIYHKNFDEFRLDISGSVNKMLALNTKYNPDELFYGHAFATGTFSLKGSVDNLRLEVRAKSEKGTVIHLPLSYAVSVTDNDFIIYVTKVPDSLKAHEKPKLAPSNISVALNLDITPDADVDVILPYEMGRIQGRGAGNIRIDIDLLGENNMHGTYSMDRGTFQFTFKSLFSRIFEIEKGSSITFNGSPTDADVSISAIYKTRAPLGGLPAFANDAENSSRRIPLNCTVKLSNNLFNPDIRFAISFPDADAETQRRIYSSLDTTNQAIINQQMISLLAINSFSFASENTSFATNLGTSSFSLITSQLSNWLSQISKNFDVGINYRPNQNMSMQELEVLLSTQLFNNRVVIEGSFGKNTNPSTAAATSNTQDVKQWVGDINIEVKVTEDGRFRVKAFNRANNSLDPYTNSAPYTQGVGFIYRKEFEHLFELFKHQKKKMLTK